MIQRIQSLFMLLSAIVSGLLFFIPLAIVSYGEGSISLTTCGVVNQVVEGTFGFSFTLPLVILAALGVLIPIFAMLRFKRRKFQINLNRINILVNAVFVLLVVVYYLPAIEKSFDLVDVENVVYYGAVLPILSMLFSFLAIRGVKKDIDLLNSVDRLR
ncbi:MAG: DUF4293 domain-containing protein [Candidatus Limimorpha sp.]